MMFLSVAQMESGHLLVETELLEILPILSEATELLQPIAQENRVSLQTDYSLKEGSIRGDRGRLIQVLSNILGNALKIYPGPGNHPGDAQERRTRLSSNNHSRYWARYCR